MSGSDGNAGNRSQFPVELGICGGPDNPNLSLAKFLNVEDKKG